MSSWFFLPPPKPHPNETPDETSSSAPDWLLNRNFKDRVHFEPWNGFEREVDVVQRALSRLGEDSDERKEIQDLLKPVSKDLQDEGWRDCWSESTLEQRVTAQVWRAIDEARDAVKKIRKRKGMLSNVYFVPQKEVRSEKYALRVGKDLGRAVNISNPEHIIPDFCCFAKGSDSRKNKSPLATVELKGSRAKLVHRSCDSYSPERVSEYCNSVFSKKPVSDVLGEHFQVTKRLSQALTQAFHTESGSGSLYNHVHALFFFIDGKKVLKTGKVRVVVKVSRLYPCDKLPSNLHAFTAWTFVIEKLAALRAKLRKRRLLDAIEFISTASREHEDDDDRPPDTSSEDPSSPSNSSSSDASSPKRKKQKGHGAHREGSKKSGSSSSSKKRPVGLDNIDSPTPYAFALSKRLSESFETSLVRSGIEDAKLQVDAFRNDVLVKRALGCDVDILGEGAFGVVRRALVSGRNAAVKYRNRCIVGTVQYVFNEIVMYCHIASRYPHLLNYSVPNLIAIGFDDWAGPVLVTEMVGDDVHFEDGYLSVGKEQLQPEMSALICKTAISRLRALHSCGILHRDVAFRNLRARISSPKKGIHGNEKHLKPETCATWWIDLGFSKIGGCRHEFDFELAQCVSLFANISHQGTKIEV